MLTALGAYAQVEHDAQRVRIVNVQVQQNFASYDSLKSPFRTYSQIMCSLYKIYKIDFEALFYYHGLSEYGVSYARSPNTFDA